MKEFGNNKNRLTVPFYVEQGKDIFSNYRIVNKNDRGRGLSSQMSIFFKKWEG
jgi:hypothetical protein